MHVPYNKLWHNIPDNVKVAFASSQDVFLELDKNDEDTMNSINNCQLLPNNEVVMSSCVWLLAAAGLGVVGVAGLVVLVLGELVVRVWLVLLIDLVEMVESVIS